MNVVVAVHNTSCALTVATPQEREYLEQYLAPYLTVDVPGAKYTWDYKKGAWDGKTTLTRQLGDKTIYFLTGLLPDVQKLLQPPNFDCTVYDNRMIPPTNFTQSAVELYPYQYEAVKTALRSSIQSFGWWPRGILRVATGGGKTEIAVAMYSMHRVPTVFLVHRRDLLIQAKERFEKYGIRPGIIGGGEFNPDQNLTIAMIQTLNKVLEDNTDVRYPPLLEYIGEVRQLFLDECHLIASTLDKGNMYCRVLENFDYAYARWGLTATAFMRSQYDNLLLMGGTGNLLCNIGQKELVEAGYLTPPKVKIRHVPGKMIVKYKGKRKSNSSSAKHWKEIKDRGIKFNQPRNILIAEELIAGQGPTLALVDTIEQGTFIQQLMNQRYKTAVLMLTGSDDTAFRKQIINELRTGQRRAIIATTIFDEGVDIPELRKIIIGSGGKSQVKLLQRLGRGLRKADNKAEVEIIDFQDYHHPILRKHAREREKVYREEGFQIDKESARIL